MQEKVMNRIGKTKSEKESLESFFLNKIFPFFKKMICAFLLGIGEFPLHTFPFGMAYLCSSRIGVLPAFTGLLLSAFLKAESQWIWISSYLAAGFIALFSQWMTEGQSDFPKKKRKGKKEEVFPFFGEGLCLRIASSAVCMLLVSLYRIVLGGFSYYDLFAAILSVTVTPIATAIFALGNWEKKDSTVKKIAGTCFLLALIVSAKNLPVFALQFAFAFSLLFAFYLAKSVDFANSAAFSVLSGVLISKKLFFIFLPSVLLFDCMRKRGKEASGVLLGCFSAVIWIGLLKGFSELSLYFIFALLAGSSYLIYEKVTSPMEHSSKNLAQFDQKKKYEELLQAQKYEEEKMENVSNAYASLSEMFYRLGKRMKTPEIQELKEICLEGISDYCDGCREKTRCEERKRMTKVLPEQMLQKIPLESDGKSGCALQHRIYQGIRQKYAELCRERLKNDRAELLAMNFEGFAEQLRGMLEEKKKFEKQNEKITEKLQNNFKGDLLAECQLQVCGMAQKQLIIENWKGAVEDETRLMENANEVCGMNFQKQQNEMKNSLRFLAVPKIRIEGAKMNLSKGQEASGDSIRSFEASDGRFFVSLNDGMGNGKEAASVSELSSVVLEKLLQAGSNAKNAIRTIHQILLTGRQGSKEEYSVALDLLEINLYTGRACFIKCGAAPCFIIREQSVHKLQNETPPIGILKSAEIGSTDFQLRVGDTVVMVSDGIVEEKETDLLNFLSQSFLRPPKELLERLYRNCCERAERDDCSAVAFRILSYHHSKTNKIRDIFEKIIE